MGNELSRLFVVIGAKTTDFERGLAKTKNQMKQLGIAMTAIGVAITTTLAVITVKWANAGDEVAKLAQKTGFTTERLSELRYAADLSGGSLASLETGIKRMQSTIIDARDGLSTAITTLKDLGLTYEDLKDLAPEEQFELITNRLADISDPTLKAAVAVDIFGRAGTDMLPMLSSGSAGLDKMRQEAHDLGLVFSSEAAKKAEAFNDAITRLKGAVSGLCANIGEALAPVLTKIINKIASTIQKITDWMHRHPALTKIITEFALAIGVACTVMGTFILVQQAWIKLAPLVGAAFHAMLGPLGLITLAISGLVIGITALISHFGAQSRAIEELKGKIKELGDTIISDLGTATRQAITDITTMADTQKGAIQSVIDYIQGIQTEGMELIPENVMAKIREIGPSWLPQLEAIQQGIKDTNVIYDIFADKVTETRLGEIEIELKTPGLTDAEIAALYKEKAGLLSEQANKLLKENAPDLISILEQQQIDIDIALATQITSWQTHWKDISDGWDGSLAYLRDTIIPQMNLAIEKELLPPELAAEIQKRMEEILAGVETTTTQKPATTPWWAFLNPILGLIAAIEEIQQAFNWEIPEFQGGGIVKSPTLAMIGEGGPELVLPLDKLGSIATGGTREVHIHIGSYMGDEISLRKFGRQLKQILGEEARRTQFSPIQGSSYFDSGRASV